MPSVNRCCEKAKIATSLSPKQFSLRPVPSLVCTHRTLPSCLAGLCCSPQTRSLRSQRKLPCPSISHHRQERGTVGLGKSCEIRHYEGQSEYRRKATVPALCYLTESSQQPLLVSIPIFYLSIICLIDEEAEALRLGYLSSISQLIRGRSETQTYVHLFRRSKALHQFSWSAYQL